MEFLKMTRDENLESLRAYIRSFETIPDHMLNQGVSQYEFKVTLEIILEILEGEKKSD